jgi:hypothetical protein
MAGTDIIKARIVLVANRFIRVIFRGAPGVSDSIILAKCSCSIRSLYKSMQHEMRKNFRTARGSEDFMRNMSQNLELVMHRISWSKWAESNTPLSPTHSLKE